jgi:hypothetical protein
MKAEGERNGVMVEQSSDGPLLIEGDRRARRLSQSGDERHQAISQVVA